MNLKNVLENLRPYISEEELKEQDNNTFLEMFEMNVLGVTESDIKGKNVLDIGAYRGYFSMLCVGLGAKSVIAVEANPDNFVQLKKNTDRFKNICPMNVAVFNGIEKKLSLSDSEGTTKTTPSKEGEVSAIALGDLLALYPYDHDVAVKIDTEGAEYDILLGASGLDLSKIQTIFLETHQVPHLENIAARTSQFIRDYLRMFGFFVSGLRHIYSWEHNDKGELIRYEEVPNQDSVKLERKR